MDACVTSVRNCRRSRRASAGFSLAEVMIAVGIVAFSFIGLLGLLPVGFGTFRQAMATSVGAQIYQRVLNDAQQTDFKILTSSAYAAPDLYFDEQGTELPSSAGALYYVHTRVVGSTAVPQGATQATLATLATITVQIAANPGNKPIAKDGATNLWNDPRFTIATYSGFIAQND